MESYDASKIPDQMFTRSLVMFVNENSVATETNFKWAEYQVGSQAIVIPSVEMEEQASLPVYLFTI